MYSDFEFWDKIDDWPKDQPPSYEFCGKIDNHETIYEEMEKFDGWTHSFAEDFTEELIKDFWSPGHRVSGSPGPVSRGKRIKTHKKQLKAKKRV